MRPALCIWLSVFAPLLPSGAQTVTRDRELARAFTGVREVVELSGGRVLVRDETGVYLASIADAVVKRVAGSDAAPLAWVSGDTVYGLRASGVDLFVDGRRAGYKKFPKPPRGEVLGNPVTVDSRGFVYGTAGLYGMSDSMPLLRWSLSRRRDTVLFVPDRPLGRKPGTIQLGVAYPFALHAAWGAGADGMIAIATPDPYRVTVIDADGTRHEGPVQPYDRIPVTDEIKSAYLVALARRRMDLVTSAGFAGLKVVPMPSSFHWPDTLPPFGALRVHRDGTIIVVRTVGPTDPLTLDVFDRAGNRTGTHALEGDRYVGGGSGSLYVVEIDEKKREHVVRYRIGGG